VTAFATLLRKELQEDFRSPRGLVLLGVVCVALSAYSLLFVSVVELSLLDNSEALYMLCGATLAAISLAAGLRGADGFAGERERGTLETLLVAGVQRRLLLAKLAGAVGIGVAALAVAAPYLWAIGSTGQNLGTGLAYLALTGLLVACTIAALALAVSARVATQRAALGATLGALLLVCSPLLLGASLRQSRLGVAFDWVNPLALALNTLDSVIIDGQPFGVQAPRLAVLAIEAVAAVLLARMAARSVKP
jgi:ABC-type transport system involved in multi-copper enzyme maturation permease subunit